MTVREVLLYPHPLLKQTCPPVGDEDSELEQLITDLIDTLGSYPGCVGIAAPQIGYLKRVAVIDVSRNRKPVPNRGLTVLVNPVIEIEEGEEIMREGCLSIPEFTANVKRARTIRVSTLSSGARLLIDSQCFEARVMQHEIDHLDGKLFLDRCASLKTDVFRRKRYSTGE